MPTVSHSSHEGKTPFITIPYTRPRSNNTSSYKGVRRISADTWEARVDNQAVGYFDTAQDASRSLVAQNEYVRI
jgi:hypothetical protein